METKKLLSNKPLSEKIVAIAGAVLSEEEQPLFAIAGDLLLSGTYGESALIVCEKVFVCIDSSLKEGFIKIRHTDIESAKVKRMYGNAILKIKKKDEKKILSAFRFTYSIASICETAALFMENMRDGGELAQQLEMIESGFEKMLSHCPKCGRTLSNLGKRCIRCESKGNLSSKLLIYLKPYMPMLIFGIFLSVIVTAMALVPPYITKIMVDDVLPSKSLSKLTTVIVTLLLVYVVQHLIGGIRAQLMRKVSNKVIVTLKNDIYRKIQFLPMSFFDKASTGSVINRASSDASNVQNFMLRIAQEAVVQLFLMVGIFIIMFVMDWRLTLLSLVPVPLVVWGAKYFGQKVAPYYKRIWRRSSAISSILADTIPGIRVIKSFNNEKRGIDRYTAHHNDWLKEDLKATKYSNIFSSSVTFIMTCGSLLIWSVGGQWIIEGTGKLSIGLLVSFISYTSMFYGPVNFFAGLSDGYQSALASAEKILDIIDAEPENDFGHGNVPDRIEGKIEFRNVNFSFDKNKKVLSNISLVINPGDIVGIVGTTGSGKSTLINLIMRFYDSYEGEILIDDKNINEIDLGYFRSQIGYVQQEPLMFKDTIFNNIAYGESNVAVEKVINAADIANAHGFIARLPDGYDTMLGERGIGLSGGERQRLSIARAVIKNPSLLIFDEATASVDSETENLIQEAIERLISGRTTLMIAHRLSTLRKANKIIVVDKGEIIEMGTPQELLALKGKYHKLIQIQSMAEKVQKSKEEESFE